MAKKQQKKHKKAGKSARGGSSSGGKSASKKVTKTGLQPIGDGVLIKPEEMETTTPSGIIIPDTAKQEKSKIGRVVAVGEGRYSEDGKFLPMRVQVGTKVYFNPGWENEVEYKGDKFFLVHESDVKAIIN